MKKFRKIQWFLYSSKDPFTKAIAIISKPAMKKEIVNAKLNK